MQNNILRFGFSRLINEDFKSLASRVIKIVEGHNPETLEIKEIYDLLVELKPQIESIQLRELAHPISGSLTELRRKRIAFAQGIINEMRTIENGKIEGKVEYVNVAKPLVLQHLKGASKMREKKIYDNIVNFVRLCNLNPELSEALDNMNLSTYLTSLQSVNIIIEGLSMKRGKSFSERPKNPTPGIVAQTKVAMENLFKQIEVAQLKNQELDYKPLIDELNNEIADMKARVKARASYNKKKAEGALNKPEVVEKNNEVVVEIPSEEPSESTQSNNQRMYPMNTEVDNEDNLEELDIKKTVAVSTKQTRLPIVSPEA